MGVMTHQITSLMIVCSSVYSCADQRIHQSSASLAFVWGIHRCPVNSPHKGPVTRKMFPFYDVIMFKMACLPAAIAGATILVHTHSYQITTFEDCGPMDEIYDLPMSSVHYDNNIHGANMGPIWAYRTQVGPMLAPWTLLSGQWYDSNPWHQASNPSNDRQRDMPHLSRTAWEEKIPQWQWSLSGGAVFNILRPTFWRQYFQNAFSRMEITENNGG